jgi:hypothetical protein
MQLAARQPGQLPGQEVKVEINLTCTMLAAPGMWWMFDVNSTT